MKKTRCVSECEAHLNHVRNRSRWSVGTTIGVGWIYIGRKDIPGVTISHGVAALQSNVVRLEGQGHRTVRLGATVAIQHYSFALCPAFEPE